MSQLYNKCMAKKHISKEIADFIVNAKINQQTRKIAKRYLIDWIASVIAGSKTKPIQAIEKTLSELGGKGQSTILFSNKTTSITHAAFINAAAAHVIEMDDLDRGSISHPGSSIIASSLAIAEYQKKNMNDLLDAIIIGYEIMIRIGEALGTEHYKFWHTTGTAGTIGVAAAISRISKFNKEQTLMAIGSAGTMTAGLWEFLNDGAMSKQLHPAKAAHDGILACLLAKNNFSSATKIIEGKKGIFAAMAPKAKPIKIIKNLSLTQKKWKIENVSFKMYASCRHTHPAVEGALQLKSAHSINYDQIKSIKIEIYSQALELLSDVPANTPYAAKFNLPFCIASALIYGNLGPERFTEKTIKDKKIIGLAQKIAFTTNHTLDKYYPKKWPSNVTINMEDNTSMKKKILYPFGDPENAVTNSELKNKFISLTNNSLKEKDADIFAHSFLMKTSDITPKKMINQIKKIRI
jgi:2-methylcitrate dehydratase PrpD